MSDNSLSISPNNWSAPARSKQAERAELAAQTDNPSPADTQPDSFRSKESNESWSFFKPYVRETPKVPTAPRSEKPVIAILVQEPPTERSGSGGSIYTTGGRTQMYADAVEGQGGLAHFIWDDGRPAGELLKGVHGLLIPGGGDLNPELYGQKEDNGARLHTTSFKFDNWEKQMTETAIGDNLPTRGICRGHQLINVMFKNGTLQQDIQSVQSQTRPYPYTVNHTQGSHPVAVVAGTKLADITQSEAFMGNSYHHQAIAQVGDGLTVSARSADGTIEGIENADGSIVGVQFHPERDHGDLKARFFTDFVTRSNDWRQQHDPLSADELAALMTKAASSRQAVNAGDARRQAIAAGIASLDKQGWEVVSASRGGSLVNERNIDDAGPRCEVRGRKTHKLAMASTSESQRDEMLLSMTDSGIQHLPQEAQDVISLVNTATDLYKNKDYKMSELFKANYERIPNPIEAVWAFRKGDLMFTPPDAANSRIRSIKDLSDAVQQTKNRRQPDPSSQEPGVAYRQW